jgi:hypothetical protein
MPRSIAQGGDEKSPRLGVFAVGGGEGTQSSKQQMDREVEP